jgi:L-threonylcarbamoyladenylate synthase
MDKALIRHAAAVLRAGGLVAFPTETVYGLGANAHDESAVKKVFAAKGRPADHPLIVHLADAAQLDEWAHDLTPAARTLAAKFWPGPLTLVVKRASHVLDAVTGGQDTVAIRVPSHPVAQALLREFGAGVVAPSANRFGHVSATTAQHVRDEFGDAVGCVIDGGECEVGIESAIVDVSREGAAILRPGWIHARDIETALGTAPGAPDARSPRTSGMLEKHYAPAATLMLVEADLIYELAATLTRQGQSVAVLARTAHRPMITPLIWHAAPLDAAGYAHALYANLRALDDGNADVIIVEETPAALAWAAIRDRLSRAAAGR